MADWNGYGNAMVSTATRYMAYSTDLAAAQMCATGSAKSRVPFEYVLAQLAHQQPSEQREDEAVPVKERTPEEIEAQLLARYRELEAEAAQLKAQEATERTRLKCSDCRWVCDSRGKFDRRDVYCRNALLTGFEGPQPNVDRVDYMARNRNGGYNIYPKTRLCGPEKALWEPIPTRWQLLVDWLSKKFGWDSN